MLSYIVEKEQYWEARHWEIGVLSHGWRSLCMPLSCSILKTDLHGVMSQPDLQTSRNSKPDKTTIAR